MKICIIGGGPIGSYAGYLLAKKGHSVDIYEEHDRIGQPVQCAGIVSKNLSTFFDIDELKRKKVIINEIRGARIKAPDGNTLTIKTKSIQAYILDREKFDIHIADLAKKAGVKYNMEHRYADFNNDHIILNDKKSKNIVRVKTDFLIGADGPLSEVAKTNGLQRKHRSLIGLQYVLKCQGENDLINTDSVELDLGASKEFFGWVIPIGKKTFRIGLASRIGTRILLKNYLSKLKKESPAKKKITVTQGGIIPYYKNVKVQKRNIYLVGDAAKMIKNTTGGGIIMGLTGAKELSESIGGRFSFKRLDLTIASIIRKTLDKLNDRDKNRLIALLKKRKNRKLLEKIGDMDYPSRFILKLLLNEPQLLLFFRL